MRATSLSYSIGASLLLLASSLSGASAVTFALSPLYQCESANLTVTAEGNFTVEAREYPPSFFAAKYFVHFKGNRKAMQAQYLDLMRSGKA